MSKFDKLVNKVLSGNHDTSIHFIEITSLLSSFGFLERVKGDHHIFYRAGINEIINIQPNGSSAKPYQVKQVREIMLKYHLGASNE
ncbi:MAG: type II toxin-antitoxin system HicA family toxin [Termitinemataceae bacterium]|nr:MAG: type II toxin-antitoxin system HicA family toxin [Termitinemataceae bacterium]